MSDISRITFDADKNGGRPSIRGTRMRVRDILDLLASGASHDEILADYPFLERDDILAALDYAARQSDYIVFNVA